MISIIEIIIPTFLLILAGYIFGKTRKFETSSVVDICMFIFLPALVFTSMLEKQIILTDALKVWTSALIIVFGTGFVAYFVFKSLGEKHSGLYIPITIMNVVFIMFPVAFLAYGNEGLAIATLFFIPPTVLTWTVGIYIVAGKESSKESFKEIFRIPLIYAVLLGLILNFLNLRPIAPVMDFLNMVSAAAVPLMLVVLGIYLSEIKATQLPTTFLSSFLRIGAGFFFGLLCVYFLRLTGVVKAIVLLDSIMPSATVSVIIASKYNSESELVSSVVFLTTLLSVITVPLLLIFLS